MRFDNLNNRTMRNRIKPLLLYFAVILAITAGCSKSDGGKSVVTDYDERLLYGTWYCPSLGLYYEFDNSHTGRFYDANGDGKGYEWSLDKDVLQIKVKGEGVNVTVFETYIITSLSSSTMKCHDELTPSESLTFNKQS